MGHNRRDVVMIILIVVAIRYYDGRAWGDGGGSVGVLMMKVVGGMLVAVTIFAFHSGYPSSNPMVYSDWFKNNQLEWSTTYLDYRIVSVASQLCLIICYKTI